MIQYIHYKVNYEKEQFDDCKTGYSPELYEFLAGNSYAFKEHLSKNGYVDPIN